MTKTSKLILFTILLISAHLSAAWRINEKVFTYYINQNKYIEIDSDKKEKALVVFYRSRKSTEFINHFFPFTDDLNTSFPENSPEIVSEHGWVTAYQKKYSSHPDLKTMKENDLYRYNSWEWVLQDKKSLYMIPIMENGVYLMEIRTSEQTRFFLVNISDLAILVKRDPTQTLIYSVNRKTGSIIPNVNIKPDFYKDSRNRQLTTGQNGLLFLDSKKFEKFGKISASYSNNNDFIDASHYEAVQKENFKVVAFPDKDIYFRNDTIKMDIFFYKKDEFQDFTADSAESYKIAFGAVTNTYDAKKSFLHEPEINISPRTKAGVYPLLVLYKDNVFTNWISIINEYSRRIFVDIDTSKSVYLLGERLHFFTKIYNAGGKSLKNIAVRHEVQFYDLLNGELVRKKRSGESRLLKKSYDFSLTTGELPPKSYRIRTGISIRFADGYTLHSYKDYFILKAKDEISLSTPKEIFLTDEAIDLKIDLKRYIDSTKKRKIDIVITDKQKQERSLLRKRIELNSSTTNIVLNMPRTGNFLITASVIGKGKVQDEKDIWIIPKQGDIPYENRTNEFVKIISDKDTYAFGDIARILIISKKKNINALFTYEGTEIFFAKPLEFQNNYEIIDLPIVEQNKPNSFIVIQAMISNNLLVSSKDIFVPYQSKNIMYNIDSFVTNSKRRIFTSTKNIWGRDISTFSTISILPTSVPVNRITSAYYQDLFYHRLQPIVQTYQPNFPKFDVYRKQVYRDSFDIQSKDLFPFVDVESLYSSIKEQKTNSLSINEYDYFGNSHLMMRINSCTRDGKLASTNYSVFLNTPIEYSFFLPEYLHYGDKAFFNVYMKNLGDIGQKTRIRTEFVGGDMMGYQTNTYMINSRSGISSISAIPMEPQVKDKIDFHFQGLTHKKNVNIHREIDLYPWPKNLQYSADFTAKKSYHKIYLNMFLFPQISFSRRQFKIEDTIMVTIKLNWKKNHLPESSYIYIRDIVPSGFMAARLDFDNKKNPVVIDYVKNEDYVEFKIDASKLTETIKINYLITARVAGKYAFIDPMISMNDLLLNSEKDPLKEKKTLSVDY